MIGFFVFPILSPDFSFFLSVSVIGVLWTIPLWEGRKGKFGLAHTKETIHLAGLLISPLFPMLAIHPSLFPSADEPAPHRPAASHSQSGFSPSISSPARQKISPEAKGEQGIFCYSQRRRKKNVLLLDMSEIKSV